MTRLLGVDLGERRIGLAVADEGGMAMPLVTLRRATPTADAEAIVRLAAEQGATELVVGLPLHASGDAGAQAEITRTWVAEIEPLVGMRVTFRDERYTSHLAEQRVGPMKRGRSGGPPTRAQREVYRARIDREAASIILQDELNARAVNTPTNARDTDGGSSPERGMEKNR